MEHTRAQPQTVALSAPQTLNPDISEPCNPVHRCQTPTVEEKAISSEGGSEQTRRRAAAFGTSFRAHLAKLRSEPGAYGRLGLAELFEMREECLREFGFADVYRWVSGCCVAGGWGTGWGGGGREL